ncbi:MAG: LON peptidase substrate-binding domain-containing protein [Parvibaculaceae bacterium]
MSPLDRYQKPEDLPRRVAVFPLPGALLLPRTELPLNIFEPRYLQMVGDALSGSRIIGMVQPASEEEAGEKPSVYKVGCAGRITSYSETPDGRFLITLSGICRFRILRELDCATPYRQVEADYEAFTDDLEPGRGEGHVDRALLLKTFDAYLKANNLQADWQEVNAAPTEALVNSLSVMSPYAVKEKQALLEAADLKTRADVLIAITEMTLARGAGGDNGKLQ